MELRRRRKCTRRGRVHSTDWRRGGERQPHGAPHHDQCMQNRLRRKSKLSLGAVASP